MKKYVKPDLAYESFVLTNSIAACGIRGDEGKINYSYSNGDACTYFVDVLGLCVFSESNTNCTTKYGSAEIPVEAYCYFTSANGATYFGS